MENKKRKSYESPQLTVVSFKTERGYQASSAKLDNDLHLFEFNSADPYVTQYEADNSWLSYGWE